MNIKAKFANFDNETVLTLVMIDCFKSFVWTESKFKMSRQKVPVNDYLDASNARIKDWKEESRHDKSSNKMRIKNKISALRARMSRELISTTKPLSKDLAGYQTNFNRLVKYFF